jgi:acetyl-CoA synthetase
LISAVADSGARAVVVSSLPESLPDYVRERLKASGIAPMQGIEDCLFAIKASAGVGAAQANADNIDPVMPPKTAKGKATALDEPGSKRALAEYGLSVPAGKVCKAGETGDAARTVGFPVVLKAVSSELAHKSEAGAVAVNLCDDQAVQKATQQMDDFDLFLIESMVQSVVCELIVGVTRDPTFGLALTIGAGGVLVELVEDSVSLLLPVKREDIRKAIQTLKVHKLIAGYRGKAAGDIERVVDSIESIARYAIAHDDRLLELDVNPLCVLSDGAIAVDAFIRTTSRA